MNEQVGQGQVADGVVVLMTVEVVTIVAECFTESVTVVEHRGDAIEAETVEMEVLQPVLAVGQKEMHHLILAVVKTKAVPSRMLVPVARIEILVGITGQIAKTLHLVLHSVTVYNIHNDGNTIGMGRINQCFQFLRRTETAGCRKETADMIAERSIVGMFLYGHNLDAVVAILDDTGQHIFTELIVSTHLLCVLRHTDMALVNQERRLVGPKGLFLPYIGGLRLPYLGGEYLGLLVLYYTLTPCGNTLAVAAVPIDVHLVKVSVLDGLLAEFQFPIAEIIKTFGPETFRLGPSVEISHEIDIGGIGCPLAEHPSAREFMKSVVLMAVGKVLEFVLAV